MHYLNLKVTHKSKSVITHVDDTEIEKKIILLFPMKLISPFLVIGYHTKMISYILLLHTTRKR